jgi:hypothetical protein
MSLLSCLNGRSGKPCGRAVRAQNHAIFQALLLRQTLLLAGDVSILFAVDRQ